MNREWATAELNKFLSLTELYRPPNPLGVMVVSSRLSTRGADSEIVASAQIVEQILDRVLPRWRSEVPDDRNESVNRWCQHREAAERAQAVLARDEEVRRNLGDDAPRLSASHLHPWIWDGARALWRSGHYREAVGAAARKLNAEAQNKLSRRDVSEADLFKQAFSLDAPKTKAHGFASCRTTAARHTRASTAASWLMRKGATRPSATPSHTARGNCPKTRG